MPFLAKGEEDPHGVRAAPSPLALKVILGVALVMAPVVIAYQVWACRLFRYRVAGEDLSGY